MHRYSMLSLMILLLLVAGLAGCSDQLQTDSSSQSQRFSVPTPIREARALVTSRLQAYAKVDSGDIQTMTIQNGIARLTINDLAPGNHSYTIEFKYQTSEFGNVSLATATKNFTVAANETAQSQIAESDYIFPDDDGDRITNLKEVDSGWSPKNIDDPAILPDMVPISAGSFTIGSPASEPGRGDDETQKTVSTNDLFFAKHEVTRAEFRKFVAATGYTTDAENNAGNAEGCYVDLGTQDESGNPNFGYEAGTSWQNPKFTQDDTHPVVCVSWNDAQAYAKWLSSLTGQTYRLPTEAEWENAARAGSTSAYQFGDNADNICTWDNIADQKAQEVYANFTVASCNDGYIYTAPAQSLTANPWGLFDTQGNVREWTCSSYEADYNGKESVCAPENDTTPNRSLRGGSWFHSPNSSRLAVRLGRTPVSRADRWGFRLVREP